MFRKWVMGGLALLIILVLFVWVSSKQLLVSGVKKRLLDSLQEVTGEGVTLGGIDLSLFPPSLILQDLKLPGDQVVGQVIEGQELLTVKEARLWFSPWSFFTEFFVIQRLELSEPRLYLIRDGEQRSNFDRVIERLFHSKASAGEFHPPKIVLKKLSILKGQVYYKTEVFSASLPDITVTLLPDLLLQKAQIHLQTGSASLDWENHHLPIDQIDGLLLFNPKGLTIKNLTVKRSDSHLVLRGEIHDLKQPRLDLYLGVTLNSGDFPSSLSSILPISGRLRFQTEIQGSTAEPAGKGNLSLDPFLYHQQSIGPFSMLFSYQVNGSTLSMTQVQGRALGGGFSGQFKLPLTKNFPHYETELELSGIDPFPFLAYFYPDLSGFSKPVYAHLSLKGSGWTISSLDGRGSLTLRSSQTPSPIPVPSARLLKTPSGHKQSQIMKGLLSLAQQIDLQFTLSHKRLSLLSAHLSTPRSILALAGTIDEDQKMILAYHLAPGDLGELLPLFGLERLEGRAELSGLLTGSFSQPLSQAHLTVAEANYKGRAVGSLSSQLLFQNDALDISPALLQKGSSLYKLLGRITFPREKTHLKEGRAAPVYNLTLHIEKGIPQEVVALFYKEIPIHGSADGDLYLTGTPKEFQLKGTLNVGPGSAYGQPFDSGSVTGIVERNGITLEHVGLRRNDTVLAGQGTISFDGSFSAQLSTEGFQLEEIKLIHNLFPALTGTIIGMIRGKGPFRDPHVTLTADIARIAYEGQDLGEGRVEAALEERKLRVHSDLFEKALSFTGHLGLISPYPYEVGLLLNQVRIDPFLALAQPKLFSALLLSSTGEISGMGTLSRLQEASFQISLSDLRLQLGEHLVRNDGDIRLQYQGGVLKVDALKFQGEETTLAISGSLEPFREYNLFVRGETDLNLLRLFTREITHGKGKAYLALRIFDRWSDPKIRGGLTSQGGTIRSETLSQTVNLQSLGLLFNEK